MKRVSMYLCALALVGCGTDGTSVVTGPSRPKVDPSVVQLYLSMPRSAETIGLVSAKSGKHGSDQSKMDDALEKLKEEAGDAGANGIVIQQTGESDAGSAGVAMPVGNTAVFFSNQQHRETINGIAIYVSNAQSSSVGNSTASMDFDSASAGAQKGDSASQYTLGLLYMQGTGIPQDFTEALKWLILAKADSDPNGELNKNASSYMDKLESQMTPAQIAQAQQEASEWFKAHARPNAAAAQ